MTGTDGSTPRPRCVHLVGTVASSGERAELGYEPVVTRKEGLAALRTDDAEEFAVT